MSRKALFLVPVAVLVLVALVAAADQSKVTPPIEDSGAIKQSKQTERQYLRSRFSGVQSSVWRYQSEFAPSDLDPVAQNNPHPEPQPERDRPTRLTLSGDKSKAYVALPGTEASPGNEVAVIDLGQRRVGARIKVGVRPHTPVLHPGGRFLVVTNELSNYASIVDTRVDAVVGQIPLDYYCQGLVFAADGKTAWVANRYLDQVLVIDLELRDDRLSGQVREVGGFSDREFFGQSKLSAALEKELKDSGYTEDELNRAQDGGLRGINAILRDRCSACHEQTTGGFLAGPDPVLNFLSAGSPLGVRYCARLFPPAWAALATNG